MEGLAMKNKRAMTFHGGMVIPPPSSGVNDHQNLNGTKGNEWCR